MTEIDKLVEEIELRKLFKKRCPETVIDNGLLDDLISYIIDIVNYYETSSKFEVACGYMYKVMNDFNTIISKYNKGAFNTNNINSTVIYGIIADRLNNYIKNEA